MLDCHPQVVEVALVEVPHITVTKKMEIILKTDKITL